jgi:hypothetical protein
LLQQTAPPKGETHVAKSTHAAVGSALVVDRASRCQNPKGGISLCPDDGAAFGYGNTNYGVSQGLLALSRLLKDAGDWVKIVGDVAEAGTSRPTAARTRSSSAGA